MKMIEKCDGYCAFGDGFVSAQGASAATCGEAIKRTVWFAWLALRGDGIVAPRERLDASVFASPARVGSTRAGAR